MRAIHNHVVMPNTEISGWKQYVAACRVLREHGIDAEPSESGFKVFLDEDRRLAQEERYEQRRRERNEV